MNRKLRKSLGFEHLEVRQVLSGTIFDPFEPPAEGEHTAITDFQLVDVNPTSASFNQGVSPRDYLGGVSAWYFGHAT